MLTVLLVDDDAEFTEVACTIIEFLGHEVLTAATLKEARDWLEKETFDHVLLDFMLPDGSGAHLFNELDALPTDSDDDNNDSSSGACAVCILCILLHFSCMMGCALCRMRYFC